MSKQLDPVIEEMVRRSLHDGLDAIAGVLPAAIGDPLADYRELVEGALLGWVRGLIADALGPRVDVEAGAGVAVNVTIED